MDAIDFHSINWLNVPRGFVDYKMVSLIKAMHMRPGSENGLSFEFDRSQFPPGFIPVGWEGPIQYTVCAGRKINGKWYGSGFIQMWEDRKSTGAPIIAQWNSDWAYDANRWGVLTSYRPKAGDEMFFMIAAGNAREGSQGAGSYTLVPHRTNIVVVKLPADDNGDFNFSYPESGNTGGNNNTPEVPPVPTDPIKPLPTEDVVLVLLGEIKEELKKVHAKLDRELTVTQEGDIDFFGKRHYVVKTTLTPKKD